MAGHAQLVHYKEFCRYREEGEANNSVDLTRCTFMYPTTMLPLLAHASRFKWTLEIDHRSTAGGYLNYMLKRSGSPVGDSTFLAPVKLPRLAEDCQVVLKDLYVLRTKSKFVQQNVNAYTYTIGELVDNIYEHSEFHYAYVMAQKYPRGGYIELCFFDDGITIPGSFNKLTRQYEEAEHTQAILAAVSGKSTKPGGGRGYGLSSNVRMFQSIGGEVFIASGYGAIFVDKGRVIPYTLDSSSRMDGTLISLRVRDGPRFVNVYEYADGGSSP
jgi:hypothetical protein